MSDAIDISLETAEIKRRGPLADFFTRLVREKPLGTLGGIIVLVLLFAGIFADVLAPYGMKDIHLEDRLEGPSGQYLLGTDHLGRDVLSRIIHGARVSVIIGLSATSINLMVALLIGATTGFVGGPTEGSLGTALNDIMAATIAWPADARNPLCLKLEILPIS